jgi:hypothetical protein
MLRSGAMTPGNDQDATNPPDDSATRNGATAGVGLRSSASADTATNDCLAEHRAPTRIQPCALAHCFSSRVIEAAQRH